MLLYLFNISVFLDCAYRGVHIRDLHWVLPEAEKSWEFTSGYNANDVTWIHAHPQIALKWTQLLFE